MRLRAVLPALLLLTTTSVHADAIDDLMAKEIAALKITGASVAVVKDGKVVKAQGYGLADKARNVNVSAKTLFNIGSITKQFTATAVLLLQEDGKLSVDDEVRRWLPELPEDWKGTKLRHLLGHIAGTGDWPTVPGFKFKSDASETTFLKLVAKAKRARLQGVAYEYSNVGYSLLGVVVHRASGIPYEKFVTDRIFRKLGMSATRFIHAGPWPKDAAVGYTSKGVPGPIERAPAAAPSGGVLSTVLDMAKLDAALYDDRLLKASSREMMWTVGKLNDGSPTRYGFGWGVSRTGGDLVLSHGGSTIAGFKAYIRRDTGRKLTIILLTNRGGTWQPGDLVRKIVTLASRL